MDVETRLELIKRPPIEEIITEDELRQLLQSNEHPQHYIGFEISGMLHLGNFILSGFKVNDLIKAGVKTQIYLADWHSYINNKMGGDWSKILIAAKYYEEGFRFLCPGAKIVLGSELYRNNDEYWRNIMKFSKHMTLPRTLRCMTIMGRTERERLDLAQLFYPPMQAVDVKEIGADIPHGGVDQRKAHILAREVFPKMGWEKPVAVHHHVLMGIAEPVKLETKDKLEQVIASKMSKSKPWTAIFIHDNEEAIKSKMQKAWCPPKQIDMNPILEIVKYLIFHEVREFTVERPAKYGGDVTFASYGEVESEYSKGNVHPQDLKNSVSSEISKIIEGVRRHFEEPANKKLMDVFKEVEITR